VDEIVFDKKDKSILLFDSQYKSAKFYRRKDKSLGFSVKAPKIYKEISSVKDFMIKGTVGNLESFYMCKTYLLLEERESLNSIKIPIVEDFSIDLSHIDMCALKSKDKTVIDFFVVVENSKDEIIRKEKIKYIHGVYKKDNYFEHIEFKKSKATHHFLLTITPFNNLKIESYSIPNAIDTQVIPEK